MFINQHPGIGLTRTRYWPGMPHVPTRLPELFKLTRALKAVEKINGALGRPKAERL